MDIASIVKRAVKVNKGHTVSGNVVYDVEIWPNYFTVLFYCENQNKYYCFEICSEKDYPINEIKELISFLNSFKNVNLIGYNSNFYDDFMIGYISNMQSDENMIKNPYLIIKSLYLHSQNIISTFSRKNKNKNLDSIKKKMYEYSSKIKANKIDLMRLNNLDKSLKLVGVLLNYPSLEDLPYKFNQPIDVENISKIKKYNQKDVEITYNLLLESKSKLELREKLSEQYKINLMSKPNSGIANSILNKIYKDKTGLSPLAQLNYKTERGIICVKDCIMPNVKFECEELSNKLKQFYDVKIDCRKTKITMNYPLFEYKGLKIKIGAGGIHSEDAPGIFNKNTNNSIVDIDVASMYPAIILNNNISPAHIDKSVFISLYSDLVKTRLSHKKKIQKKNTKDENYVASEGLKIVINSIYGKFGSKTHWLYDPLCSLKVTINGQLYLLMLLEQVAKKFEVISLNTDGMIVICPNNKKQELQQIYKDWEAITGMELEESWYSKYIRKDVNNYMAIYTNGDIKSKGDFNDKLDLDKGLKIATCVKKAIRNYYLNDINKISSLKSVTDYINNDQNIYNYCYAQKVGKQFTNEIENKEIQDSVRYYVCNSGYSLRKYKVKDGNKKYTFFKRGQATKIFNEYVDLPFSSYHVKTKYYIKEALKIIDKINSNVYNKQTNLFS